MSNQLNVKLDAELHALVVAHVRSSGVTASQLVRDALRTYFNAARSPRERGWREGFLAGVAQVRKEVAYAIAKLSPVVPEEGSAGAAEQAPWEPPAPAPARRPKRPR